MAVEIFPDSPSLGMSPRISFSHDLSQSDVVPVEQYIRTSSSSSATDFDFCVFRESFDHDHSSSADELFFDGKILPIQIKKRLAPPRKLEEPPPPPLPTHIPSPPPSSAPRPPPPKTVTSTESEEKHKSFWRFKRSTSLNCGSGYGRTLCPLPLLSRSNSTGSAASGKRPSVSSSQKQSTFLRGNSAKQTPTAGKPPLKKNHHHAPHGGGIRFNPLLHVPPATFFGLGSFFSGGKASSKKKH